MTGLDTRRHDARRYRRREGTFRRRRRIMLLQAEAGKYGHTLIGTPDDPCCTMIFFENSYSLDTRSQIEDRIHRMGATGESCLYVDLSGSEYDAGVTRCAPAQRAHVPSQSCPRSFRGACAAFSHAS